MTNIEKIEQGLKDAKEEHRKAEEELKKFMEEENLKWYKELLGMEDLRKAKERLEDKEKEKWTVFKKWDEALLSELAKGKGNEQIA